MILKPRVAKPFLLMYQQTDKRYYFLKGGRSSAKSWHIADRLLGLMVQDPSLNLICLREVQSSIKHSSKKLISDRIEFHKLNAYFEIQDQQIKSKMGNGVIIFSGLQNHTVDSIKSLEGFDLVWVEEAQTITAYSLELLTPTIRKEGARLFFSYNPKTINDPVYVLEQDVPTENKVVIFSNYIDNPFCPTSIIEEAEQMKRLRPKKYQHIYLGGYGVSDGLIFENVTVRTILEDEIKGLMNVQGLDFGYTNDETSFCTNYINEKEKTIYVFDGFYAKGLSNGEIAQRIKDMLCHKHMTTADSSEPKSIDSLRSKGIYCRAAKKGKDSINIGIDFLLDYKIVINSHLKGFITESEYYVWDVDRHTGIAVNKPVDKYNHFWDSFRYSVEHLFVGYIDTHTFTLKNL